MPEHSQKIYLSAQRFIDLWHKSAMEMTNLDFFIFKYVNYLGKSISDYLLLQRNVKIALSLNTEDSLHLAFILGKNLSVFLHRNCFGECSSRCVDNFMHRKDNSQIRFPGGKTNPVTNRLNVPKGRECFYFGIMNSVILNGITSFFNYDPNGDIGEGNLAMVDLADFLLDRSMDFIFTSGANLLENPDLKAINRFTEIIETKASGNEPLNLTAPFKTDDKSPSLPVRSLIKSFSENMVNTTGRAASASSLHLIETYLLNALPQQNMAFLDHTHLQEFMSYKIIMQLAFDSDKKLISVFNTLDKFIEWLYNNYKIDLRNDFRYLNRKLKLSCRRVIRAYNVFHENIDLFMLLLFKNRHFAETTYGWFQIEKINRKINGILTISDIKNPDFIVEIPLGNFVLIYLDRKDLLELTLYEENGNWKIIEIHNIFPQMARPFILNRS